MRKFHLCALCAARFGKSSAILPSSLALPCHICDGSLSQWKSLVQEALLQARDFEWETFSVSSSFKKSVLAREDEVADISQPGDYTSMKNSTNSFLAKEISDATGKKNGQRSSDMSFSFDFSSGKAKASPQPLYIHGHYIKLSRQHCQSRWHCSDCGGRGCPSCKGSGMNYPSIEDEISKAVCPAFGAKEGTLHASGREDVDVRCLGTGRPFVLEIKSPKKREADLAEIKRQLSKNNSVQAIGLKTVSKAFMDAVCNSHFEKEYSALVSADRPLTAADAEKIESLSGVELRQETPTRVLARRSDLERRRTIYRLSASAEKGGKLRLKILAEAGTYIKELISSDNGRTKPSVSELLSCKAVCDELDVISIHDFFLQTVSD